MNKTRITEAALVLPALYLMDRNGGSTTTSELIKELTEIMQPTGEDARILNNRNDSKFSQIVRNLNSHKTFQKNGFADYDKDRVQITDTGRQHLNLNHDVLKFLLANNVSYIDLADSLTQIETDKRKKKIDVFDENQQINEGDKTTTESALSKRSAKLRNYAIEAFTKDNRICCTCCGFNFNDFYGEKLGGSYIEIHHIKPIFKYEDDDIEKTLKDALNNLAPVCSNCHSIIHRKKREPTDVDSLRKTIEKRNSV